MSNESSSSREAALRASELTTDKGKTSIADQVVSKIAGIATREIDGVHSLGGGASRAVSAIAKRIPGASTNHSQGVTVEVGEVQAAADIDIVAEYGVAIADLAASIRQNVIDRVQRMTGLEVVEVNITVHDINVPNHDDSQEQEDAIPEQPRVQ